MKIFRDVLSEQTITAVEQEIIENFSKYTWSPSGMLWPSYLSTGSSGDILQCEMSAKNKEAVLNDLKDLIPHTNTHVRICVWNKGASLAMHDDSGWDFGATVYMNRTWNKNLGGVFLYSVDEYSDKWNAVFPSFNTMILNTERVPHLVTPISYQATEYRVSLQVWGIKE